ncbi:MAG: hypothetical protein ACLGI6_01925 [Gammaproteobacteria bacterium]
MGSEFLGCRKTSDDALLEYTCTLKTVILAKASAAPPEIHSAFTQWQRSTLRKRAMGPGLRQDDRFKAEAPSSDRSMHVL